MKDLLIVGGGFAGICCAQEASNRNLTYTLVDSGLPNTSSRIAAGIMNPITGRKYKPQWGFEELYASAQYIYGGLEKRLGVQIMYPMPIYKIHSSEAALEAWLISRSQSAIAGMYQEHPPVIPWQKHLDQRFGALLIPMGMRINTQAMTLAFCQTDDYLPAQFDHQELEIQQDHVIWRGHSYRHVVFCEGHGVEKNPWFRHIPMRPNKGECMIVQIPYLNCPVILQKNVFAVPLGNDRYWIGGTSDNTYTDDTPTTEKATELTDDLRRMVRLSFTVENHLAAIRPTMRDRSPAVGTHHTQRVLHILNGLGTKGSMLAPYYARQLIAHIFDHTPIPKGADVNRFRP